MAKTHFKKMLNPNYLGSFAFNEGEKKMLTIKSIGKEKVVGEGGSSEQLPVVHWVENELPFIMNATNCKKVTELLGTPYVEEWVGHRFVLGVEKIKVGGAIMDGTRIQGLVDKKGSLPTGTVAKSNDSAPICEMCENPIKADFGMSAEEIANKTKGTYGKVLCPECAKKLKNNG